MIDQTTKDALNQHITQTLWKRGEYDINTYKEGYNSALTDVQKLIESLPCEEVGTWTTSKHKSPNKIFTCSKCKGTVVLPVFAERCYYDFCPNCGAKMEYKARIFQSRDTSEETDLQKNIDTIRDYDALKEKFKPYLTHCLSEYAEVTKVDWHRDLTRFEVYYEETFCGCTENHLELFPANVFDMTPDEYKELVEKKKQEEARRKALEREQNERQLLAKLKKKYESEEVKDIFRKAEGILLNEEDK